MSDPAYAKFDNPDADHIAYVVIDGKVFVPEAESTQARGAESDEAWMCRVYPQHAWTPDDGITYQQFCRLVRSRWEAEHTQLRADLADARADCSQFCGDLERLIKATGAETVAGALEAIAAARATSDIRIDLMVRCDSCNHTSPSHLPDRIVCTFHGCRVEPSHGCRAWTPRS